MTDTRGRGGRNGRSGRCALVVAVACLAAWPAPGAAQDEPEGVVSGTVVEAGSGRAVPAATVTLQPVSAGDSGVAASGPDPAAKVRTTLTDPGGRYRFQAVPPGWYRLDVTSLGYREGSLVLELPPSWNVRRSLGLEVRPVALRSLDVAVTPGVRPWSHPGVSSRDASPGRSVFGVGTERPTLDARAITTSDVTRLSTIGEPDVLRALQRLPGASGQGDFSAGLWTRNAPWGLTQVLLDGLPLYHPLHLGGTASGMASDGLAAVLFLPGARPAALSDGAAGTVNLVTRRAQPGGRGSAGLTPMALRAHGEGRWLDDRAGLSVTARRSWWDVVTPPALFTGRENGTEDLAYWFADVTGRADVRLGEWGMLEAGGIWEEDRIDGNVGDLVGSSDGRWGNHLGWAALAAASGPVRGRITVGRTVHLSRTRPWAWSSFYDEKGIRALDAMDLHLARTVVRLEAGGAEGGTLGWNAGVERNRETLSQFGMDAFDRAAPGTDGEARVGWIRAWGQATLRVGPARLSGGAALDHPLEGDPPGLGLLPNGSLRVDVGERLTLEVARGASRQFAYPFARAGRSFGPALSVDHVWMIAGDGRSPLTSNVTTASAELELAHGLGAGVTAWWRVIEGLALDGVASVVDGRLVPVVEDGDEGRERGRGVELALWRRSGRVRGELSYTRGRADMEAPGGAAWPSPADRRHAFDFALSAHVSPRLRLGVAFRAESGWPYVDGPWSCPPGDAVECDVDDPRRPTDFSVERAPGYRSLDLAVDWVRPGESVTWGLSLGVRNALGRDNPSAWRPDGCRGTEVISGACESPVGLGAFSPGLTRPTPSFAARVLF